MFRNSIMFLSAGILATLAACHQAKPATSVSASSYQAQEQTAADSTATQDRSARELPGYAPQAPRTQPIRWPAPAPAPAPAQDQQPPDDFMRQFDLP